MDALASADHRATCRLKRNRRSFSDIESSSPPPAVRDALARGACGAVAGSAGVWNRIHVARRGNSMEAHASGASRPSSDAKNK